LRNATRPRSARSPPCLPKNSSCCWKHSEVTHPTISRQWCSLQRRISRSSCRAGRKQVQRLPTELASCCRHDNASITRFIAGCFRFLNLIQCFDRPAKWSRRFDTDPSSPIRQAARNRSGPILTTFEGVHAAGISRSLGRKAKARGSDSDERQEGRTSKEWSCSKHTLRDGAFEFAVPNRLLPILWLMPEYRHQTRHPVEGAINDQLLSFGIVEGNRIICNFGYTEIPNRRRDTAILKIENCRPRWHRHFDKLWLVVVHFPATGEVNRSGRCNADGQR